jgi:hypothetical protein
VEKVRDVARHWTHNVVLIEVLHTDGALEHAWSSVVTFDQVLSSVEQTLDRCLLVVSINRWMVFPDVSITFFESVDDVCAHFSAILSKLLFFQLVKDFFVFLRDDVLGVTIYHLLLVVPEACRCI